MTRRQMLTALFGAAVLTLPMAGCGHQPVQDEPGAELILRYAENQPEDYPTTQAALAFADLVAQRTNGRVKVLVYSGGELGAEQSVIQQMQFGGIDFSRVSLSQLAEYEPALSVLQLPYLYTDADQMWRVLDGTIGDEFLSMLESLELTGLSWFDAGVRSIYTRQKVTGLADLQGLTIRVQESDMMSEMITDLGAKPVKVVYSKVYAALHNGEIDGAENNWPSYEAMGHYEVAPYFLKDEHTRVPEVQLASPMVMEKLAELGESYPEIIRMCARESAKVERKLWAQQEAESEENMRAVGIEVTELDEAEKEKFERDNASFLSIKKDMYHWMAAFNTTTRLFDGLMYLVVLVAGTIQPLMPWLLSFAAGAMMYVVVEELIPEASEGEHSNIGTIGFAIGFIIMMVLDSALG